MARKSHGKVGGHVYQEPRGYQMGQWNRLESPENRLRVFKSVKDQVIRNKDVIGLNYTWWRWLCTCLFFFSEYASFWISSFDVSCSLLTFLSAGPNLFLNPSKTGRSRSQGWGSCEVVVSGSPRHLDTQRSGHLRAQFIALSLNRCSGPANFLDGPLRPCGQERNVHRHRWGFAPGGGTQ